MSGFGNGPYGYVNAGSALAADSEEVRSSLSSSRKIDFPTGRYVLNDENGFEAMDDVAQAVMGLIAFAWRRPTHITPQHVSKAKADLRTALMRLTVGKSPVIKIESVDVETAAGEMNPVVKYRNLRTNTVNTVAAKP